LSKKGTIADLCLCNGEERDLDAWIQYQAKMRRSSDIKYDVKVNGKWKPKPTSHQRRL